jgi:predicted RNase H-like HicB family nuclease
MQFLVTVDRDGEGRWVVNCPAIPGCALRAENRDEAFAAIKETIKACLEMRAGKKLVVKVEVLPWYITEARRGAKITWTGETERIAELIRTGREPGTAMPPAPAKKSLGACSQLGGAAAGALWAGQVEERPPRGRGSL